MRNNFQAKANRIVKAAEDAAEAVAGAIGTPENPDVEFNPMADPEVVALVKEIEAEAAKIHSVQELSRLQQKLMRLLTMAMARSPIKTWTSLADASANLYRMILYARRVEADMPAMQDPAIIRQEAARQLLEEVASVLNSEEQRILGGMLEVAADRLGQKNGVQMIAHEVPADDKDDAIDAPAIPDMPAPPTVPIGSPKPPQEPVAAGSAAAGGKKNPW